LQIQILKAYTKAYLFATAMAAKHFGKVSLMGIQLAILA